MIFRKENPHKYIEQQRRKNVSDIRPYEVVMHEDREQTSTKSSKIVADAYCSLFFVIFHLFRAKLSAQTQAYRRLKGLTISLYTLI